MKILVKIIKVENGFTHYQEINRVTGKVMIEDYQSTETFEKALNAELGFELIPTGKITKARVKDGHNSHRGMVVMAVDCETESLCDAVTELLNNFGIDTPIHEESDKYENGLCIIATFSSDEMYAFNDAYKTIKNIVKG
ncbi:hypothetical protein VmeM32_00171 [Vibrio phage vB_VmeM-32]|nr:hypothetical protein VmeM32_00171 [Vibrio phage vB_VmeM-32]